MKSFILLSVQIGILLCQTFVKIPSEIKSLGIQRSPILTFDMIDTIVKAYMDKHVDPCVTKYSLFDVKTHFDYFLSTYSKLFIGYEIALYEFLVVSFVEQKLPESITEAIYKQYYKEVVDERTCSSYPTIKFANKDAYRQFLNRVRELNSVLPNKEYLRMVCVVQRLENVDRKNFENVRDFPQALELIVGSIVQKEIASSLERHGLVNLDPIVKKVIGHIADKPSYKFWFTTLVGNKILDCQIAKILQYEFLKAITAKPVFQHWVYLPTSPTVEKTLRKTMGFREFMIRFSKDAIDYYFKHQVVLLSIALGITILFIGIIGSTVILRYRRKKRHTRLAPADEDIMY